MCVQLLAAGGVHEGYDSVGREFDNVLQYRGREEGSVRGGRFAERDRERGADAVEGGVWSNDVPRVYDESGPDKRVIEWVVIDG